MFNALKRLSDQYQDDAIDWLSCVVVSDSDEALHWIELKHMGERSGAGSVLWGSEESARFRARIDPPEIHIQALDFLQDRGEIDQDLRSRVAVTTLKRLLGSPVVRSKLGLDWSNQQLKAIWDEESVAKALCHVVNEIANGVINVRSVYTSEQRTAYANQLSNHIQPNQRRSAENGVPLRPSQTQQNVPQQPAGSRPRRSRTRNQLIPRDCPLNIPDPRIHDIEQELRRLIIGSFPNAVGVMFRVFIELSADDYISKNNIPVGAHVKLAGKMNAVTNHLVSVNKLTSQQAAPARTAAQGNSFLAPSITIMHQYVHNQHMFPSPADLRIGWDNLRPWIEAVWPV